MLDLHAMTAGFWGPPTSSVDWCEANYRVTPYIAEFWNTLSSLAMVGAGTLGFWLNRRWVPRRFLAAYGLLAVVGLGSIAFHATLRFELQMLDELPMLYLVTLIVYLLVEPGPVRRLGAWFPWGLAGYDVFLTILCSGSRGRLQFWLFQLSFGSLEVWSLWRVFRLYQGSASPAQARLFRFGMSAYLLGIAVWFCDLRFCPQLSVWLPSRGIPNPQLHAWWHVLVAGGFYALLLFIAREERWASTGAGPTGAAP